MLLASVMRRSWVVVVAMLMAACSDEDPNYGAPSAIKGKDVSGVPASDFFTKAYDPAENALAKSPTETHEALKQIPLGPTVQCFTCHGGLQGQPGSPAAFAGYVRQNGSDAPAANADVVVVSGGQRIATKTGNDGMFWIAASAGKLGPDARVAVRDAQGRVSEMKQALPNGGCTASRCHGPGEITGVAVVPE